MGIKKFAKHHATPTSPPHAAALRFAKIKAQARDGIVIAEKSICGTLRIQHFRAMNPFPVVLADSGSISQREKGVRAD
jgi:hypothetical protein